MSRENSWRFLFFERKSIPIFFFELLAKEFRLLLQNITSIGFVRKCCCIFGGASWGEIFPYQKNCGFWTIRKKRSFPVIASGTCVRTASLIFNRNSLRKKVLSKKKSFIIFSRTWEENSRPVAKIKIRSSLENVSSGLTKPHSFLPKRLFEKDDFFVEKIQFHWNY